PINLTNPAPHLLPGQEPPSANQPLGPYPPAQLNATNLHKALEPLDTNSNNFQDFNNALDSIDD
ncbi:hypothetical protein C0989_005812, partial [Termitomyces sp. Mn162]